MVGLIAGAVLWALTQSNRLAAVNRNYTAAKAVVQKRIDEALTAPYSPPSTIPAVLTAGTSSNTVTIIEGAPAINGMLTTTVGIADTTLNIRRVNVGVTWVYKGKSYNVAMVTARAPD